MGGLLALVHFGLKNDILHSLSVGFIIHTDLFKTFVFSLPPSFYMDIHNLFSEQFEDKVYAVGPIALNTSLCVS